ncbi:hypothetical protein TRL7639_00976 [Falsiruegeria litorea R37]|uniref:Uncharacterized protein n=1 Tax=Falsiruegeria litorea R37 TaxID=1200284 RepID=A0A1Y5RXK8_9RHOB|nr:hypothetical protein [Falsiruegeria litorea]SLN26759.1 hypothetical protein TRL7639_00976 [Falsiruegeria litorea R37]
MEVLLETIVALGVMLSSALEQWVLGLFFAVIAVDAVLGTHRRSFLVFAGFQVVFLIAGYYWTLSTFEQQDVAGPWAWAQVVGIWAIAVIVAHAWFAWQYVRRRAA